MIREQKKHFADDYWFLNPNGEDLDAIELKKSLTDFMHQFSCEHTR